MLKNSEKMEISMDTVKIGAFLRELRKEKNLTQEQLADVFNVSARTVSRWETGSNMPDISILVEIADYYQLDVREILNGERAENLLKDGSEIKDMAEYADKEKEKMAVRTRIYAIAGICGMFTFGITKAFGSADSLICSIIASVSMILVYAALASSLIYSSGRLQTLQRKIKSKLKKNLALIILTIVIGVILLFTLVPMLLIGSAG
jgi:transcriptional regulator with XRE-family HTH domain